MTVQQKQNQRKLEQAKETQLKESGQRIIEAEEALRENDLRHQKELKKLRKQGDKALED